MISKSILLKLRILRLSLLDFHSKKLPHCEYLIVCHDNNRAFSYEGLPYSQLLDTLRENLQSNGFEVAVIGKPYSLLTGKKAVGNPISINGSYARCSAKANFFALFTKSKRSYIAACKIRFWMELLAEISPKFVIGTLPSEEICAAGKKLDIPVYDLQHGLIEHSNNPKKFYSSRLNSVVGKNGIPSSVICWNHESANIIQTMWPGTSAIVSGNPWVQRFIIADSQDNLVHNEINLLKKAVGEISKKKIVLLTTQYVRTYDRINIPSNIKDAISLSLSLSNELLWCIKFHPVEVNYFNTKVLMSHAIDALGQENWDKIIDLSAYSLPAIMSLASYHVTGYSASTLEASSFGVKTGLWDQNPSVQSWFAKELNNNTAEILPMEPLSIVSRIMNKTLDVT